MKNRIRLVLIVLIILTNQSFSFLNAHEMNPSKTWQEVLTDSNGNKYARIAASASSLDSGFTGPASSACSGWTNKCPNDTRIYYSPTSPGEAFITTSNWPSNLPVTCAAWTPIPSTGSIVPLGMTIYINKNCYDYRYGGSYQYQWSYADKQKTVTHELGHCLGFNESNYTTSIMKQGRGSLDLGWSNYQLPTSHDASDAANKYR